MDNFGELVQTRRKQLEMTQADLADALGVSQATVSRLEVSKAPPSDIRLLKALAAFCELELADILPDEKKAIPDDSFWAFCPNPLCSSNNHYVNEGMPCVQWKSWGAYPTCDFDETNFCPMCGTGLTKQCPKCQRKFSKRESKYCIRCGDEISGRPTKSEWAAIEKARKPPPLPSRSLTIPNPFSEEDIPF